MATRSFTLMLACSLVLTLSACAGFPFLSPPDEADTSRSATEGAENEEVNREESEPALATYHHEGFDIWFDYPETWTIETIDTKAEAETRGFRWGGCADQKEIAKTPIRVRDESGTEVAALGEVLGWGGCIALDRPPPTLQVIEQEPAHLSGEWREVSFVYATTDAGGGGKFPVMGLTWDELAGDQSHEVGMSFLAQANTPEGRIPLSFASIARFDTLSNTFQADGSMSQLPRFDTQAEAEAFTSTETYQQLKAMYLSTRYQESTERPNGDLGLDEVISFPECDGTQIAILGMSWTPSAYRKEVQRYLDAFPGSQYSRTDFLCGSFVRPEKQNTDNNYLYIVYKPTGNDQELTCRLAAEARSIGGYTHGKYLRDGERGEQVPC